jgi:hypothetical protein
VSTQRPLKYDDGAHRPFDEGDTVPPDLVSGEGFAETFVICAGRAHTPGAAIPLCAEMHAAIDTALLQALARLTEGRGIRITLRTDGTYLLTNTCCTQANVEF